jgi:hypothetical protein
MIFTVLSKSNHPVSAASAAAREEAMKDHVEWLMSWQRRVAL